MSYENDIKENNFKDRKFSPKELSILEKSYEIDSPCISCKLNDLSKSCENCQEEKDFFAVYKDVIQYELEIYDSVLHKCKLNLNKAIEALEEYKRLKESLPDDLHMFSFDNEIRKVQEELTTIS